MFTILLFYYIFDQINVALMSIRGFSLKTFKNLIGVIYVCKKHRLLFFPV